MPGQQAGVGRGCVALAVDNGMYTHAGRLPNQVNDAVDVAVALGNLGFEVTVTRDVGRDD